MAGGNAELRDRIVRLEGLVGPPPDGADVPTLVVCIEDVRAEVQSLKALMDQRFGAVDAAASTVASEQDGNLRRLEAEIDLLKKALHAVTLGGPEFGQKLKVPEPKGFAGARNAKTLENFVYDMEQYFKAVHVREEEKVTITSMYLGDDAKLWWRTRVEDQSRPPVKSWEDLKKELREQFLPANSGWQAREALHRVKHSGSIREYVKEFTSVMLDIKGMSDEDKVFNFVNKLQPWAQAELRRQGERDYQAAVAAADTLVDLRLDKSDSAPDGSRRNEKSSLDKSQRADADKDGGKRVTEGQPARERQGCFLCNGPHRARECPLKARVTALVLEESQGGGSQAGVGEGSRPTPVRLSGIQVVDSKKIL